MYILIIFCLINLSACNDCGKAPNSRVTNKQHFPWIAEMYSSINKTKEGNFQHLCGSTIITISFAVTAAHCIQEKYSAYIRTEHEIFLIANVHDLKDLNDSTRIDLEKIIVHPSWNRNSKDYDSDIALLKFTINLNFDELISPICLWTRNEIEAIKSIGTGKILTFISLEEGDPGYFNYQHDEIHNYPKEYLMPIRENCTKIQKRFTSIASENTFCAGGLNSGACLETGSSGSSMAVLYNQTYYLRGIVSASFIDFAGCDNYTFTLFTDVLKYGDWINSLINEP